MNQRGFATLEVILMVMVIGILASIAIPRFGNVTTAANTAKIQSDLAAIDTAISVYYLEKGDYPAEAANIDAVSTYLRDSNLEPPVGTFSVKEDSGSLSTVKVTSSDHYAIKKVGDETRAVLKEKTAEAFTTQKPTT